MSHADKIEVDLRGLADDPENKLHFIMYDLAGISCAIAALPHDPMHEVLRLAIHNIHDRVRRVRDGLPKSTEKPHDQQSDDSTRSVRGR